MKTSGLDNSPVCTMSFNFVTETHWNTRFWQIVITYLYSTARTTLWISTHISPIKTLTVRLSWWHLVAASSLHITFGLHLTQISLCKLNMTLVSQTVSLQIPIPAISSSYLESGVAKPSCYNKPVCDFSFSYLNSGLESKTKHPTLTFIGACYATKSLLNSQFHPTDSSRVSTHIFQSILYNYSILKSFMETARFDKTS